MTRKCFYLEHIAQTAETVTLNEETSRQIETVLRLRPGEPIEIRDGLGNGWRGIIEEIKGKAVKVRLVNRQDLSTESPLDLTLALAFSKLDRMDLVLRQATELGVTRFVIFRAARSQYGLSGSQAEKRLERWFKILREALCQCGRATIPRVQILSGLEELLAYGASKRLDDDGALIIAGLEEGADTGLLPLWRSHPEKRSIMAIVGPEGGWTGAEAELFRSEGIHPVHLGPRILRLETAATALVTSIQLLWGDLQ
jgi:16S rRNA (uracil1498-N3)-methyltransferase